MRESTADETTLLEPAALRSAIADYLDETLPLADTDALGERIATTLWAINPASAVDALASAADHFGAFELGYCVSHERGRSAREQS